MSNIQAMVRTKIPAAYPMAENRFPFCLPIINEGDAAKSINLSDGTRNFTCNVPANGVVSCKWNK